MGIYSNVDTGAVKGALNKLKEYVDFVSLPSGSSLGMSSAVTNITNALNKITGSGCNGSKGNLNSAINDALSVCSAIDEYQEIEKKIKDLEPNLYSSVDKGSYLLDEEGKYKLDNSGRRIWNSNIVQEINKDVENEINRLKKELERKENQINNM